MFVPLGLEPSPVGTSVAAAPAPSGGYATRSKTINAYQLKASVEMMRTFIHDVHPEGFTDAQRELWDSIEQRTLKWTVEQMQAGFP